MNETREQEILERAIERVAQDIRLPIVIIAIEEKIQNRQYDAIIKIGKQKLIVEIKMWAQQKNIGALIQQIRNMPTKGILVADYINPKMAMRLKEEGIQYVDTVGNAYIETKEIFVFVKGNKQEVTKYKNKRVSRAFGNTGLKTVYAFLCKPELIHATYREIAKKAGVAVGTVGWVLKDLKDAGYIKDRGKKGQRDFINKRELLNRWVENYPEKLQPKQKIGDFIVEDRLWWKTFDIENYKIYLGGEIAAEKYTEGYLQMQDGIVYVNKYAAKELIIKGRFQLDKNQNNRAYKVALYKKFWEPDVITDVDNYVHPVLAYADLVATADPRNMEAAEVIYEKHLRYLN